MNKIVMAAVLGFLFSQHVVAEEGINWFDMQLAGNILTKNFTTSYYGQSKFEIMPMVTKDSYGLGVNYTF